MRSASELWSRQARNLLPQTKGRRSADTRILFQQRYVTGDAPSRTERGHVTYLVTNVKIFVAAPVTKSSPSKTRPARPQRPCRSALRPAGGRRHIAPIEYRAAVAQVRAWPNPSSNRRAPGKLAAAPHQPPSADRSSPADR